MSGYRVLDAQQALDFNLDGVSLIEASAGTGKTYTIANLYLRHILAGRRPGEILVVSFTNAATDELRERIQARLQQARRVLGGSVTTQDAFMLALLAQHQSLSSSQQQQQLRQLLLALHSMDESMIQTIHGFCFAALQDHAFLSGRQFEAEIIADDSRDWEVALKDWWRSTTYTLEARHWQLFNQAVPNLSELLLWQRQLRRHPQDQLRPEVDTPLVDLLQAGIKIDQDSDEFDHLLCQLKTRALLEAHRYAATRVAEAKQAQGKLAYQDQLDLLLAALQRPGGEKLSQRLRERFPVAMIDEFQDTDPVQFGIFRQLYFDQPDTGLVLIGDPKQAIYGFRGGDIFTYIQAKSEGSLQTYMLQTNWRSQPGLVEAVNQLFQRRQAPFIFEPAIDFNPATAADANRSSYLSCAGQRASAVTLWQIPQRENGKNYGVGEIRERLNQAVVAEILTLLDPQSGASIDDNPVRSGDIAILVRERDEGDALRAALAQVGIRAVAIGRDKVFASDEAKGLLHLLEGVANCNDDNSLRRARASSLLNDGYDRLAGAIDDDRNWQRWLESMQDLHTAWIDHGFMTMFEHMQQSLEIGPALACRDTAERRLTNLTHLAELLQQHARSSPGIDGLMAWFRQQIENGGGEEAELRLESDSALVKIVTIHKSKGLEYPIVFLPFMWRCRLISKGAKLLRFHDAQQRSIMDLGSADFSDNACLAERERLAEDLRLLYVALTRARSKLYLAWGEVGDGRSKGQPKHSALAYLLHSRQTPEELVYNLPDGIPAGIDSDLAEFTGQCREIELRPLPEPAPGPDSGVATPRAEVLMPREFNRNLGCAWRINSFSGLTRDIHQVAHGGEKSADNDPIFEFPAGSHVGLLVHQLLEQLDFAADIDTQSQSLVAQLAPGYGLDQVEHFDTLRLWLEAIVATELDASGLQLRQIDNARRLNELKFDFAIDRLDIDALNLFLQQAVDAPLEPIGAADFRGLVTGIIDLVFEYRGKFYLADYKTNFLGGSLDDYAPLRLHRAMYDRRYDLQQLIYAIALHRYLGQRLRDYNYQQHFGGSFYLFLRAMRPASGAAYGVYFERPSEERIQALEALLNPDTEIGQTL